MHLLAVSEYSTVCHASCMSACRWRSGRAKKWSESSDIISAMFRRARRLRCSPGVGCSTENPSLGRGRVVSVKHPIISVAGSSGAGTTSVRRTFEQIFRREGIAAAFIEGDAFHRYDRAGMKAAMADEMNRGNYNFSHFGPGANLLEELEALFREYSERGTGRTRHYVHDVDESKNYGQPTGTFTAWEDLPNATELLF